MGKEKCVEIVFKTSMNSFLASPREGIKDNLLKEKISSANLNGVGLEEWVPFN